MISPRNGLLLSFGLAGLVVAGFTRESARYESAHWLQIASDSNYTIAIDTARIVRRGGYTYEIWYRTDHAVTRLYRAKPFNREIVQSILECGRLRFKIEGVDMSMGTSAPVAQQRTGPGDLGQQPWHQVEPETIEAVAANATCDYVRQRATRR